MSLIYINPYAFPVASFLDTYPGALAAYSLRSLSSSVTNVVRVRRSSGSPSEADFTATQVANGELATWVGAGNDGFVTTWYDQSGNSRDATQTTDAKQPRIVLSGGLETEGSKPAISWTTSGVNETNLSFTAISNARSLFTVRKATLAFVSFAPFIMGHTSAYDYHPTDGSNAWLDATYSSAFVRNGSNYINGASVDLTTAVKDTNYNLFSMIHTSSSGNMSNISTDRNNQNRSWRGTIQEIIIYSSDQTTNRAAIELNINAYYGIFV